MKTYIIELKNKVGQGLTVVEAIDFESKYSFMKKRSFKIVTTTNKNEYKIDETFSISINHLIILKQDYE